MLASLEIDVISVDIVDCCPPRRPCGRAISAEKARNVVGARANGGKWFRDEKKPFSLVVACNLFVLVHSSSMSIRLLPSFITMANPTVFVVLSFHHFALLELSPPPCPCVRLTPSAPDWLSLSSVRGGKRCDLTGQKYLRYIRGSNF